MSFCVYGFAVFHWFRVCEHWMFHQFLIRVATKKPFYFCIRLNCTRKYGEIWRCTRQTTLRYAIAMRWKITENEAGPILKRNLPLLNDSYWKIVLQMTLKFQSTFYLGQFWLHFFSRYFSYVRSCFECKNEQVWIHCELSLYRWFSFSFSFSCECNTNLWNCNMNSHWIADTQKPLKMYSSIFPFNETSDLHQNSLLLNIYRNEMSLVIPKQIHFIYHFVNQLAQMETHKLDLKKRDHRLFALFNHFIWKCASSISSNEDLMFFSSAMLKSRIW